MCTIFIKRPRLLQKETAEVKIKPDALVQLPDELIKELRKAALTLCDEEVKRVLQKMREQNSNVADAIAKLVDEFRYDQSLKLCEKVIKC